MDSVGDGYNLTVVLAVVMGCRFIRSVAKTEIIKFVGFEDHKIKHDKNQALYPQLNNSKLA